MVKIASTAPAARETTNTRIGRALASLPPAQPGEAGFLMVSDGIDALAIRLLMADQAEKCIDTQYYEIDDDLAGHLFIEALLRAADRGVRVRLLLDDYRTQGHDSDLANLRAHPNFEMRIYNPFARKFTRLVEGFLSFARVNRRMHNKSFTIDNQMTVIGGRNIGDPYFSASRDVNFTDLDVVGIGAVVSDVSNMFDDYWNSQLSIPVDQVASRFGDPSVSLSRLMERLSQAREMVDQSQYAEAVESAILEKLQSDLSAFTWAPYKLAFDLPEKTLNEKDAAQIRSLLVEAFDSVRNEVILISPYFVPRLTGVRRFKLLRDRGVEVTVVTNSLASNNQIYAHGGYAPVRKPLLKMGVRLFELRADARVVRKKMATSRAGTSATLHTKAFAIDRKKLFIGSFNFDPRSANINTEMGVFIDSSELAEAFVEGAQYYSPQLSYQVVLNDSGKLRWKGLQHGEPVLLDREPLTSLWQRIYGKLVQFLPIRGQV